MRIGVSHRAAIIGLLFSTMVTACGESSGDPGTSAGEKGVREVLTSLAIALPEGDGPRACSFLGRGVQVSFGKKFGGADCINATAVASRRMSDQTRAALGHLVKAKVRISTGTATLHGDGARALAEVLGSGKVKLSRFQGVWMVE